MSRIIVKQLPKNITEEKLRDLFSGKGSITDLQLKYTPDGKFRQFCFIGYQNEDEAQQAIKFFNNTCIQTSRIKVELCAALGSEDKPQVWSKYAKEVDKKPKESKRKEKKQDETKLDREAQVTKVDEILSKHKDDPEFQEFMKAHDRNRTLWANDADIANEVEQNEANKVALHSDDNDAEIEASQQDTNEEDGSSTTESERDDNEKLAEKPISDLEYMKSLMSGRSVAQNTQQAKVPKKEKKLKDNLELYTIKIRNIPYTTKRQDILKFFKPLKPHSVRLPAKANGFCYAGFKTQKEMAKAMLKHKSFLKGVQVFFVDFTDRNKITKDSKKAENEISKNRNPKWDRQADSLHNEENIGESGTIFFRNLAYSVTEENLQELFEKFGPIAEINLPVDALTRQIKGFGIVTFVMPEHALQAFNKLDGTDFHGRLLHLLPGKSKDVANMDISEQGASSLTFKQKKALKLKVTAQQSANWNTLFLGANAVAEILAKRFETTKEKILDTSESGSNAAVRLALGETQIVIEMKTFLEEQGVCLAAFDAPTTKRSKTIILAKNLPAETTASELTPIFAKYGLIGRLVLPPSGITALIEYCDPTEARKGFKHLAYSKFKHLPLYLEWAPENAFTRTLSGQPIAPKIEDVKVELEQQVEKKLETDSQESARNEQVENTEAHNDDEDDVEPEPCTTLFLRNLNFKTVKDTVINHFCHLGPIHTVEIAKRKDAQNPRAMVSLGYGFIQFKKATTTDQALKVMQNTTIDGNRVELKRSDRILKSSQTNTTRRTVKQTPQTGSKILVRNLPFQAKENEVRELFKAFGELRSVRLPKKTTPGEENQIRGFGFVDYITKSDAKKAFMALGQSTHLYGRKLVLEWAAIDDNDVGELRKRTAEQLHQKAGNRNVGKRKRIEVDIGASNVEDTET